MIGGIYVLEGSRLGGAVLKRVVPLGCPRNPDQLIGRPLIELLPPGAIHGLRNRVAMLRGPDSVERTFGCTLIAGNEPYDVAIYMLDGQIVIEAEPGSEEHGDVTGIVRAMIARLD